MPGKTRKDGAQPALFLIIVLCALFFFCVVLCIVCVYMCTVLLPSGGYPIAVNKYIISYNNILKFYTLYGEHPVT
jgi:hypothetical protein